MNIRLNEFNQPIGEVVPNWEGREFPSNMRYVGNYTVVTRLTSEYTEGLFNVYKESDPSNYTYLFDVPPTDYETFKKDLQGKIDSDVLIFYVILQKETNEPLGIFSLMRVDQVHGVIEVGNVNFSNKLQGTRMSTEAHYLLASYVFDELAYRRYEWKCDSLNAPSVKAAKRLGFEYEGTFRNAIIYKGRSRDTSWFSMLQEEWKERKIAFEKWLAEDNFDSDGKQIKRLEECAIINTTI